MREEKKREKITRRGGGEEKKSAKAQGTRSRKPKKERVKGGAENGKQGGKKRGGGRQARNHKRGNPSPEGAQQSRKTKRQREKVRRLVFLLSWAPPGLGLPLLWFLACPPPFFFPPCYSFSAPPLTLSFFGFRPLVPWALALFFSSPPPPPCVFFSFFFVPRPRCLRLSFLSGPGCPGPWRCVLFVILASRFPALRTLSPCSWFLPCRWLLLGCSCPPPLPVVSRCFSCCLFVLGFFFVAPPCCLWLSLVTGPGCPGPSRCVLFVLLASRSSACCALSPPLWFLLGRWLLLGGCCPPPPPFVSCCVSRCRFVLRFFFRFAPPLSLAFSGFRPRVPWALALWVCFVGLPLLGSPCAFACFLFPAWPLDASWCLLPPTALVSRGFRRCRSVLCFFFLAVFAASPPPPWCVPGALCCLVLPRCAALPFCVLCCGASPCCAVGCCVLCGVCWGVCFCVVLRCWLLLRVVPCLLSFCPVGLFAVWLAAWFWSALPCVVLCCVSLGAVLRRAAARRASWCCVVVCCVVLLRLFGVAVCCAMSSSAARLPGALCFAALSFALSPRAVCSVLCVFGRGVLMRTVVRRCAACCVCPGVSGCASSSVCAVLCSVVLVRLRRAVRVVRAVAGAWCCGALLCVALFSFCVLWCGAGSGGPWSSAGCVFRCRCPCLAAWSGSLWLVWFAVLPCFPVSCSVVLCCLVVLCCCVLRLFCGAVCACLAFLWPVVPCCAVLLVVCAVSCPLVVSVCFGALSLPAGTVFRF